MFLYPGCLREHNETIIFKIILQLIFIFLSILYLSLPSNALQPVAIDSSLTIKRLGKNIEFLEDKSRGIDINDFIAKKNIEGLQWTRSEKEILSFAYTDSSIWVHFKAENRGDSSVDWYLQQNYPATSMITLYEVIGKKVTYSYVTGASLRYDTKLIDDPTYIFVLRLGANSAVDYYLKIQNFWPTNLLLRAYSPAAFYNIMNKTNSIAWLFYGFFLIMILYNLFLYIWMKTKSYLYYVFFLLSFLLFIMTFNGHTTQYVWGNFVWWVLRAGNVFVSLMTFTVIQFSRYFIGSMNLNPRADKCLSIFAYVNLLMAFITIILAENPVYGVMMLSIAIFSITSAIIYNGYAAIIKKSRQAKILVSSIIILFLGAVAFILSLLGLLSENIFTIHGILIGGAMQVIILSLGLADKINIMQENIMAAEGKYRHLVESSEDIIFSVNSDLVVTSINNSVKKNLGFYPEEIVGSKFLDLIEETWSERVNIARQIVSEYISDLVRDRSSVNFRTTFKTKYSHEAKELSLKLEYAEADDSGYSILGKASPIIDDALLPFLLMEHYSYSMTNYMQNAELMSQRVIRNLEKFISLGDVKNLQMAIREILINAIEHGNLGISFEEKTKALEEENYIELIRHRQRDKKFTEKRVLVEYSLNDEKIQFTVTDEGGGFDHSMFLEKSTIPPERQLLLHGRGLVMAKHVFDEMRFNERGNQITVVKYLKHVHDLIPED